MHPLVSIIAPFLLLAVLVGLTLWERKRRRRTDALTECATKELRDEIDEESARRGDG